MTATVAEYTTISMHLGLVLATLLFVAGGCSIPDYVACPGGECPAAEPATCPPGWQTAAAWTSLVVSSISTLFAAVLMARRRRLPRSFTWISSGYFALTGILLVLFMTRAGPLGRLTLGLGLGILLLSGTAVVVLALLNTGRHART